MKLKIICILMSMALMIGVVGCGSKETVKDGTEKDNMAVEQNDGGSMNATVQRAREATDDCQMGEVSMAILMAMQDQDIFDSILMYTCENNVANYVDGDSPKAVGGSMRGVTFTFQPEETDGTITYRLENAIINRFVRTNVESDINPATCIIDESKSMTTVKHTFSPNYDNGGTLKDMPELCEKIVSMFGEEIELTSDKYKSSEYTVFVEFKSGETTGLQPSVYGKWN